MVHDILVVPFPDGGCGTAHDLPAKRHGLPTQFHAAPAIHGTAQTAATPAEAPRAAAPALGV